MRGHIFICSAIQICGGDSNYICEGMQPHICVSTGFVEMHPLSFAVALLGFRKIWSCAGAVGSEENNYDV